MSTNGKAATDNTQSSQATTQQKKGSGITDKIGGVVNVIHGTGEVIRGHALETGDFGRGRGNGKEIIAAGRDEVQRGLNRIEARQTSAYATGHDPDWDQRGVGDGTGVAPGHGRNAPQATAAAASRADPTSEKDRGDAADMRYPADVGTAGAAEKGVHGPSPEQFHGGQTAATAPPREPLSAGDSPGVQPNNDVRQQGGRIASRDPDQETRARATSTADASYSADVAGQSQPFGTASQA